MNFFECSGVDRSVLNYPTFAKANGAIAHFKTDLNQNLLHAICNFNATQASGTPTPAAPLPINGINAVSVVNCGVNIWNGVTEFGSFDTTTGEKISNNNLLRSVNPIPVKPNQTYMRLIDSSLGFRVFYYDKNMNYLSTDVSQYTKLAITMPNDCFFINIAYQKTISKVSINYPSSDTEYHDYNGTTAIINLGGTYYGGTVDAITGKITLTHVIGSLAIGDNAWREDTNRAGIFYGSVPTLYGRKDRSDVLACSCFKPTNTGATITQDLYISGKPSYSGSSIFFRNSAWAGKTSLEVNALLANETFVYELATPLVVYAQNSTEIPTIQGENNVFCDTGNIDVDYILSVDKYIQNQQI